MCAFVQTTYGFRPLFPYLRFILSGDEQLTILAGNEVETFARCNLLHNLFKPQARFPLWLPFPIIHTVRILPFRKFPTQNGVHENTIRLVLDARRITSELERLEAGYDKEREEAVGQNGASEGTMNVGSGLLHAYT